jgi:hypothetical protein
MCVSAPPDSISHPRRPQPGARLRHRKVPIWLNAAIREVTTAGGRITGAVRSVGSRMDFKGHLPTQFKPPEREHDDRAAGHDKEEGELPAAFGEMLPIDHLHF